MDNHWKSTNPFDDESSGGDEGDDVFHDAQEEEPTNDTTAAKRAAPLNFEKPVDDLEDPALKFDRARKLSMELFSPLERAMIQLGNSMSGSPRKDAGYSTFANAVQPTISEDDEGDQITEDTPLIRSSPTLSKQKKPTTSPGRSPGSHRSRRIPQEISTGGPIRNQQQPSRRRSSMQTKQNLVLKELASGENEFTMDYKYILLEDLGTASSWLILLLPYAAFFISLLLESSKDLKIATTGPFSAKNQCQSDITGKPVVPTPLEPCHSPFQEHFVNQDHYSAMGIYNLTSTNFVGTAFDSGTIPSIPVLSTYYDGDASFENLTSKAVAMVSRGSVESSSVLLQRDARDSKSDEDGWSLMFSSPPKTVSMSCQRSNIDDGLWNCRTPRIVDVVFSMPDAAVYAGGDLRVNIYYSLKSPAIVRSASGEVYYVQSEFETSRVYSTSKTDQQVLASTAFTDPASLLDELVAASGYTFEHMSDFGLKVDTGVRLCTFFITFWFGIYWCYKMGVHKLFVCCSKKEEEILWWESPWILFPERYYIIVLLISLLMIQEPVLAIMPFYPELGASTRLHVLADAAIGIGVQGVLFVYLSLFHGFRYHTAAITKKRTEHQRQMLQLRRAVKYVTTAQNPKSPTEAGVSEHTKEYFERFGDVDGSASTGRLRLPNDPFADGWADFLLLKLLLLFVGVASVIGTAHCRFPPDDNNVAELSDDIIHRYKISYIISVVMQFLTLIIWMYLIATAAIVTGRKLRLEPFLGTRPVQLAYRILLAHIFLGFVALAAAFAMNISQLLKKWSIPNRIHGHLSPVLTHEEDTSKLELSIRVLSSVAQQFPYSGTAATVGSGRILFATVSILITAFIFLPAHIFDEEDDDHYVETWGTAKTNFHDKLHQQRRLKRDKRLVVNLARDSRTWRVFPLAIKQSSVGTTMLHDDVFQLYTDMYNDGNTKGRGVVSVGPYTPVFCLEIACWLNEASWQAYYSPAGITPNNSRTPGIKLEGLGLRLEGAVYDKATDAQAYVATNLGPQVDGDEDSIIVIAFRGSTSATNLQTDLKSRQIPLLDQLTGIGSSPFCIFPDQIEVNDEDGWIWDTPEPVRRERLQCVTSWTSKEPSCAPSQQKSREEELSKLAAVSQGARKLLQATPVARGSFPLVHEGFQEVYTHLRRQVLDILFPVMQRQLAKAMKDGGKKGARVPLALPKIYCTGHSLGGSLAQLLALDLANNCEFVLPAKLSAELEQFYDAEAGLFTLPSTDADEGTNSAIEDQLRLQPPIAVYTFGQPRVGNKPFSRMYKQRVPHTFRVVNEGDAITAMPNYLFCAGLYKHSGLEVLLDEGMTGNILVGPTVVETMFRFHKVRTSVLAHTMQRYRDCLEVAFSQDELLEYYRGHNVIVKDMYGNKEEVVAAEEIPVWMTQARTKG